MKREEYESARAKAIALLEKAHIVLTEDEREHLEVADFGLGDLEHTGLQLVTYVNTERCCAKEMAIFPGQTCPEHRHAPIPGTSYIGKEETFRCRYGLCYVYIDGSPAPAPSCRPPRGSEQWYTVWREVLLHPGEQLTLQPDTRHWFQAGPGGAVISEFSTKSYDEYDVFTDPNIQRLPKIEE